MSSEGTRGKVSGGGRSPSAKGIMIVVSNQDRVKLEITLRLCFLHEKVQIKESEFETSTIRRSESKNHYFKFGSENVHNKKKDY